MAKTIITAALTGAITPHGYQIPETPEQIAKEAYECWKAGASIVHLHMRDDQGAGVMDPIKFHETIKRIRAHEDCDVIVNCTSSGDNRVSDDSPYGKIINFGSVRGIRAVANGGGGNVPYNTTKGAVEMLTKAYAADLRPNVQVNAIGPTITYTPMMVGILPPDENVRNGIAGSLPAQRIGYEIDVVGPAIFLASAASDMVTATTIYPDGGLVATS